MEFSGNTESGPTRSDVKRHLTIALKQMLCAGAVLAAGALLAIYTSKGMPGFAWWSVTRIPTVMLMSIAAIALAISGSRVLWIWKE
jgi:hypothetical protein